MRITKFKERESKLDISIFQKIYENSLDAILIINSRGQIINVNSAACSTFGLKKEEFYCRNLYGLVDRKDYHFVHLIEEQAYVGKTEREITIIRNDGSKFPCKVSSNLVKYENAQPTVVLTIRECFEWKKIEERLRADLLRFQSAFDATSDGMWDLNMRTGHLYLNPNALKMLDCKQSTFLNQDEIWNDLIHEKDKSRLENEFLPILNGQTDLIDVESRVKMVNGALKWIRIRGKAISSVKEGSIIRIVGTLVDITSYKLLEEEFKRSQLQLKSYFDKSSIGLAIYTPDNSWIEFNQELCQMLGFEKEELLDKSWMEVIHSEDIQTIQEFINRAIEGKIDCFKTNNRFIRKNSEILYATLTCVCIRNNNGSIHHFITSIIDITDSQKIEERYKHQQIILRTLIDSLPLTMYIMDKEGRKVVSNKADFETIGSKNEAEVLGKTDLELYPGEVGERGHNDNIYVIKNKVPIKNRMESFLDKDGNQKWLLTNKIPIFNQHNQVSGLIGYGLDITDLKKLQQKIIESESYYRTLVNISPDGIIVTDVEGRLTFSSKKAFEIFGIHDNENLIGENIFNWVAPESLDEAIKNFKDVLIGKRTPQTAEYKCLKFDKAKFWAELSSSSLFDATGNSIGLLIICRDISVRKKTEEDLISAKNKAEENDKLKTALLRNVSHEIRTPLNAILGFSTLLNEPGINNETISSYVEIIQQSSNQLLSIITDIIDISSIEANIIEQHKDAVNLNEILEDIQNQFQLRTTSKNLVFNLNEGLSKDKSNIYTDKKKLVRIISNLLTNALKFTESGFINFGYVFKESFLEFYVTDTGIGISSKYHSKIFDTFYQVDNGLTRNYEGTGLGLPICKAFVELLGGSIWLTSKLGEGSTFYFTLPYEPGEISILTNEPILSNQKILATKPITILIAEDDKSNSKLISNLLAEPDITIIVAKDGNETLRICKELTNIDLVLLDLKMPFLDGFKAAKKIRKFRPDLPLIAQSAYAIEKDKAIRHGCNDFICKPFTKQELVSIIKRYINT